MQRITEINAFVNNIVWGKYTLVILLGVGIFFTVKLRFFPVVHFGTWWKNTAMSFSKSKKSSAGEKISPFQAVATALAGSIGTGNIVGVANAIALGGAGAVFWMWVAAFFGMSTVFAENVLGMKGKIFKGNIGDKLIGNTVAGLAEYHNYFLFSTMKLQGTTISVGACNYVYCGSSDQVTETISQKIQDTLEGKKK